MTNHLNKLNAICIKLKTLKNMSWADKLELGYIISILRDQMEQTQPNYYSDVALDKTIKRIITLQNKLGGQS